MEYLRFAQVGQIDQYILHVRAQPVTTASPFLGTRPRVPKAKRGRIPRSRRYALHYSLRVFRAAYTHISRLLAT